MKDRSVYIVGGGESLTGFDFGLLRNLDTIAINDSALYVPDPTYSITADSGTMAKVQKGEYDSVNTAWVWVTNPNHCSMKWIDGKFMHVNKKFVYNLFTPHILIRNTGTDGIGFSFADFRTGYNSGFCALQLAILLGYTHIYLLGIDLPQVGTGGHFHNNKTIKSETLNKYFKNFVIGIQKVEKIRPDIQIISCSLSSRLNDIIPYRPFVNTLIEHSTPSKALCSLSILICSLDNRKQSLERLMKILKVQTENESVEILVETDSGQITIGGKRNNLLKKAKGEYVVFVDDDDTVPEDYVCRISKAIQSKPDVVGITGEITFQQRGVTRSFVHSMDYSGWFHKGGKYYRCPNHLNPVRRELALRVLFPLVSRGEDKDYSTRLLPLLNTEVKISGCLYNYFTQ